MSPRLEQLAFGLTLLAFLAFGAAAFVKHRRELAVPRAVALGVLAFAAMGATLRLAFVEPAFVHTSFHGPALVESALSFPNPGAHRAEYGQGSFFVLGLAALVLGRTAETVFHANVLVASLATFPLAYVGAHWAGRPVGAVFAAAAWSTSPLVARLAASEDAHVVATGFALAALAATELAAALGSRCFLAAGVAAALAAILARQTLYPWPFFLVAMLVERRLRGGRGLTRMAIGLAGAALLLPTLALALATLRKSSNEVLLFAWKLALERPSLARSMILEHPLLDARRLSPLVTAFAPICLWAVTRRRAIRVALLTSLAVMALVTLPMVLRSRGVCWSFRLPLYALAVALAGVGLNAADVWIATRTGWLRHRVLALSLAAALLGALGRGTIDNSRPDAELAEYRAVREAFAAMPRPFAALSAGVRKPAPTDKLIGSLAARAGVPLLEPQDPAPAGPWIFVEGVGCHAYSILELMGDPGEAGGERYVQTIGAALDPAQGFGTQLVRRPAGIRPECEELEARLLAGPRPPSVRDGPEISVEDDPPMAIFDVPRIRLRFFTSP